MVIFHSYVSLPEGNEQHDGFITWWVLFLRISWLCRKITHDARLWLYTSLNDLCIMKHWTWRTKIHRDASEWNSINWIWEFWAIGNSIIFSVRKKSILWFYGMFIISHWSFPSDLNSPCFGLFPRPPMAPLRILDVAGIISPFWAQDELGEISPAKPADGTAGGKSSALVLSIWVWKWSIPLPTVESSFIRNWDEHFPDEMGMNSGHTPLSKKPILRRIFLRLLLRRGPGEVSWGGLESCGFLIYANLCNVEGIHWKATQQSQRSSCLPRSSRYIIVPVSHRRARANWSRRLLTAKQPIRNVRSGNPLPIELSSKQWEQECCAVDKIHRVGSRDSLSVSSKRQTCQCEVSHF